MPLPKSLKHRVLALAERAGMLTLLQQRRTRAMGLFVLTYHRVNEPNRTPWLDPAHISAYPKVFEAHMRLIAGRYAPVCMDEVLAALHGEHSLPKNAVLVTVDDAYRDFGEVLYPIARRFGIQPVLFVPTAFVGQETFFWWDKLYQAIFWPASPLLETPAGTFVLNSPDSKRQAVHRIARYVKSLPVDKAMQLVEELYVNSQRPFPPTRNTLTWDELRSLAEDGVTIAPHTHTHTIMTRVPVARAREEICTSRDWIAHHIGNAPPVFAYPDGQMDTFNPAIQEALRMEHFEIAFTMLGGMAQLSPKNALYLPRIGVWSDMTPAQLHWWLTRF